jgi:hypothetical protein
MTIVVTVIATTPLTVKSDGADTAVPAVLAAELASVSIGDRVIAEVRTPSAPVLTAKETTVA